MKKIITIISILFLLASCALESEFSLLNNQPTDKELLGEWLDNTEKSKDLLIFKANDNNTFSVSIIGKNDKNQLISTNAFTTNIKGYKLINIVGKNDDGKTINEFYGYRISKNKFSFREVSDEFEKGVTFNSQKELIAYFKKNIDKKDFFGEWSNTLGKK